MGRILRGRSTATACVALVAFAMLGGAPAAFAGGTGLDDDDDTETGTPFFGFVKDLDARGKGLADAKVVAEIKGGNASLVTRADAQGHYRIAGFGKDVDPATIEITCTKDGYKLERSARRKLSNDPNAPIEVDCLMVKK